MSRELNVGFLSLEREGKEARVWTRMKSEVTKKNFNETIYFYYNAINIIQSKCCMTIS